MCKSGDGEQERSAEQTCTALVYDIQKFSLHDGPGIRTIVFFKGCPMSCPWCANPESQRAEPELIYYPERCIGCLVCTTVCPVHALKPSDDAESILIDRSLCTRCGRCTDTCYAGALNMTGRYFGTEELFQLIARDLPFYRTSEGGVTFSGGEPLLQAGFIREVSQLCQEAGISTAVETCGLVPWDRFALLLNFMDFFLCDIKHLDSGRHEEILGISNERIISNIRRLAAEDRSDIIIRIPVIPGFNDDREHIRRVGQFARSLGHRCKEVHLLPYHRMGVRKYTLLEREYQLKGVPEPDRKEMEELARIVALTGCRVRIGG